MGRRHHTHGSPAAGGRPQHHLDDDGSTTPWQQHRGGPGWGGGGWEGGRGRGGHGGRGRGGPDGPGGFGGFGPMGTPPPWLAGLFGLGKPEQGRGPRVRRGDVRTAIIDVLHTAARAEEPINGYQVIQQIAERSNGAWRPSPGSVYPTIQQLQDEGLVESDEERSRRTIRLTVAGTVYADEHKDELAAVWAPFESEQREQAGVTKPDLKSEIGQVMGAVWQIVSGGSEHQRQAAFDILVETRRSLYGVLADGHDGTDHSDTQDGGDGEPEQVR